MVSAASTPAVILAAGRGTRLGLDKAKCLVEFGSGTLLDHQLENLRQAGVRDVLIVVGFQAELVRKHRVPKGMKVTYVENAAYMDTQTGKSLLVAVKSLGATSFLQLNADVVFDHEIITKLLERPEVTKLAAREGMVGEEEIKYVLHKGRVVELGKKVQGGMGEAVGINYFAKADVPRLQEALEYIAPGAYFERAIEHLLPFTAHPVECVTLGKLRAVEIDFPEDLEAALQLFGARAVARPRSKE